MSRRTGSVALPEPPWTQAPSEVMAWGASTGGRPHPESRAPRPSRVKGFDSHVPAAEEERLLAHMARLGFAPTRGRPPSLPRWIPHLLHHATPQVFLGTISGTHLQIRLRKAARVEVRVTFTPKASFRKAWRLVARLGLDTSEGTWL